MELAVTFEKPSSRATATGSSQRVLPARAPEPYGLASMRLSQSARRSTSRSSGHVGHELVGKEPVGRAAYAYVPA